MKTAFAYHRYSYVDQKDGYTLEIQRKTTKKLADKNDIQITDIYEDEAISGATIDKRPGMLKLLADLDNSIDYIICMDQDRLSRSNEFWYIKSKMAGKNINLITDKEGIIDFTNDIMKDALSDMMGVFAKLERGMITRRVKRAMEERASKGLFIGNLKRVLGYDCYNGNLKINEAEADIVRLVFDMYIQGKGYYTITTYLNQNGYRTKFGNRFTQSIVMRILRKPLYCGYIIHLGKLIKGVHEPIISEEVFTKANIQYKENKKRNPKMKVRHLLTGFLFCGNCGARLQIGYHSGKASYGCSAYYNSLCDKPVYIRKKIIEEYIIGKVLKVLKKMSLDFEDKLKKHSSSRTTKIFDSKREQQKIKDKIDRLLEQYVEGNVSEFQYKKLSKKFKKELNSAKETKSENRIDLSFLKDIKISNIFNELDFIGKRKILSILIDKIIIHTSAGKTKPAKRAKIIWNDILS